MKTLIALCTVLMVLCSTAMSAMVADSISSYEDFYDVQTNHSVWSAVVQPGNPSDSATWEFSLNPVSGVGTSYGQAYWTYGTNLPLVINFTAGGSIHMAFNGVSLDPYVSRPTQSWSHLWLGATALSPLIPGVTMTISDIVIDGELQSEIINITRDSSQVRNFIGYDFSGFGSFESFTANIRYTKVGGIIGAGFDQFQTVVVATNAAAVAPEPGTVTLVMMSGAMFLLRRKSK